MFPELERLEIPIILYILYVPYILKGTELVVRVKSIRIVTGRMLKCWITDGFINSKIDKISSFCQQK